MRRLCILAALLATACGSTHAIEPEGLHGYVRLGHGAHRDAHAWRDGQACFGLEGVAKYRLGNECDFNAELGYTGELARPAGGAILAATAMARAFHATPAIGGSSLSLSQVHIQAKNLAALKGATAWIGKRYYNRPDVHVQDFKYVVMDGKGAGIDGVALGPGKFSYAVFRDKAPHQPAAIRHSFIYQDLPANRGARLKLDATLIRPGSSAGHGGWSLSLTHKQHELFGGDNTLALQYGVGPGMEIGATGDIGTGSGFKRIRIVDQLSWQLNPAFSGSANFVRQRDSGPGGTRTWTSFGLRPVYALHDHVKLQLEIGHDRITGAGAPRQELTKLTLAPTVARAKDFWSRPELRAFVTYARWNRAAQSAAAAGSPLSGSGVFGARRHGVSVGVQFETWFH
jgi:maltoporin